MSFLTLIAQKSSGRGVRTSHKGCKIAGEKYSSVLPEESVPQEFDVTSKKSVSTISLSQMTELMSEMLIAMLNGDTDNIEKGKAVINRIFPDTDQREAVKKSLAALEPKFQEAAVQFANQLTSQIETELRKDSTEEGDTESLHQKLYGNPQGVVVTPADLVAKYAKRQQGKRQRFVA